LQINDVYNKLIPTYKATTNQIDKIKLEQDIISTNKNVMNQLLESIDLIEKQIDIIEQKNTDLTKLYTDIADLEEIQSSQIYDTNIDDINALKKEYEQRNLLLIIAIIVFVLLILFCIVSN